MTTDISREAAWLLEEKYQGRESNAFWHDRERLVAGEPLAYVIGFVDFLGVRIDLARPLIPRPETEYWVEQLLPELVALASKTVGDRPLSILDIFAGSGCIGRAVLHQVPEAKLTFGEIDPDLCQALTRDLTETVPADRWQVCQSDVWQGIPAGQFDVILANPPYVATIPRYPIEPAVLAHEPQQALFAGGDGLTCIHELLMGARKRLVPAGLLVVEFDPWQAPHIEVLAAEAGFQACQCRRDQYGEVRWAHLIS